MIDSRNIQRFDHCLEAPQFSRLEMLREKLLLMTLEKSIENTMKKIVTIQAYVLKLFCKSKNRIYHKFKMSVNAKLRRLSRHIAFSYISSGSSHDISSKLFPELKVDWIVAYTQTALWIMLHYFATIEENG